ncbi:MAG TPA: hypothetical protein P5536_08325 [Methanoregulaceae archaeon]|nr:MAG: hypothetical protein IPI71_09925 [Methanolinea sp.]HON82140.1 hypothetical protein [Methanoregulaceae archaeon]HRT16057.1 hypothetical protein [Methanoregulaceae archaeon]HRU31563.1 hypothetical protein [Methanoregulaceae archaeon]
MKTAPGQGRGRTEVCVCCGEPSLAADTTIKAMDTAPGRRISLWTGTFHADGIEAYDDRISPGDCA